MKFIIETQNESYLHELEDVVRAFEPFASLSPDGEKVICRVETDLPYAETIIKFSDHPIITKKYVLSEPFSEVLIKRQ